MMGTFVGFCEYGNEISRCIKFGGIVEQLRDLWLQEKG
jgi:hypothetical protein